MGMSLRKRLSINGWFKQGWHGGCILAVMTWGTPDDDLPYKKVRSTTSRSLQGSPGQRHHRSEK